MTGAVTLADVAHATAGNLRGLGGSASGSDWRTERGHQSEQTGHYPDKAICNMNLRCTPRPERQVRHFRNFRHNRYSLPDPYADTLARSIFLRDVSGRNLRKGCLGGTPR